MYASMDEWAADRSAAITRYARARRLAELVTAAADSLLGQAVATYAWPDELDVPEGFDAYRPAEVWGHRVGEDLAAELAVIHRTSEAACEYLLAAVATLTEDMPQCWERVTTGQAPLWQARRVAEACASLDAEQRAVVDARVAPALGAVAHQRLARLTTAAVEKASPGQLARRARDNSGRWVSTKGDDDDPLASHLSARLDRADAVYLDATVQLLADILAEQGDTSDTDHRRAKALGLLANPAAAVQLTGVHTTRGMDPTPATDQDKQDIVERAQPLVPAFPRRAQVYLHLWEDNLDQPGALARLEGAGPLLVAQIQDITHGCAVRVTPVIHLGDQPVPVDAWEIPDRIREQVLLRNPYSVFPYAHTESRLLDLDHLAPWRPGHPGQTNVANLAPLTRRAHRAKTHARWRVDQTSPGVFDWTTPSGQHIRVDAWGSHPMPARE
jgi:hypothetical protein